MNEDVLWVLKILFAIYCIWFIWGGPERIEQEVLQDKKTNVVVQKSAAVYQPKVYHQTIILR